MGDDIVVRTIYNGYDRDDLYRCRMCNVTFREPFPEYYDTVPCVKCGWPSLNRCLDVELIEHTAAEDEPAESPTEFE